MRRALKTLKLVQVVVQAGNQAHRTPKATRAGMAERISKVILLQDDDDDNDDDDTAAAAA